MEPNNASGAENSKPKKTLARSNRTSNGRKRIRTSEEAQEDIPEHDRNVTTQAQRKRQQFQLTRASLQDPNINETSVAAAFARFDGETPGTLTWGSANNAPISGLTRKIGTGINRNMASGAGAIYSTASFAARRDIQQSGLSRPLKPFNFLALEVPLRKRIYGYLLKYPWAILVKPDWQVTERNPNMDWRILRVCKLINEEATSFIYQENTIQAIFRNQITLPKRGRLSVPIPLIHYRHLKDYQNIVLDMARDCWLPDWHEKTAAGMQHLAKAKPKLQCVTLIVRPFYAPMTDFTNPNADQPLTTILTFSEFFYPNSPFMAALRKLAPMLFRIIIRKDDFQRLSISINMEYLNAHEWIEKSGDRLSKVDIETDLAYQSRTEDSLRGLTKQFEECFEDEATAIVLDRCTVIEDVPIPSELLTRRFFDSFVGNGSQ